MAKKGERNRKTPRRENRGSTASDARKTPVTKPRGMAVIMPNSGDRVTGKASMKAAKAYACFLTNTMARRIKGNSASKLVTRGSAPLDPTPTHTSGTATKPSSRVL